MILVKRPDLSSDADWQAWNEKVTAAMDDLRANYKPGVDVVINDELYKAAMPFLLRIFNDKCAYCEVTIVNNQPGDVEHYRPKGRVCEEDGKKVVVLRGGAEIEHPGYWWLAYSWANLLPACTDCNRRRRHGAERNAFGKGDRFGILGSRAVHPEEPLVDEVPLLLDPTQPDFDPAKHFEFRSNGMLKPKTREAEYTCKLLGLNDREKLMPQRELAYWHAMDALTDWFRLSTSPPGPDLARKRRFVNDMWEGRSAYSGFGRQGLSEGRENHRRNTRRLQELPLPEPEPPLDPYV